MEGALDDITVLDLGQVIGMPFCTMLLADMGAKVIKVESRERGAGRLLGHSKDELKRWQDEGVI